MLLVISIAFGVYIVVSLWYMHRLNARIRAHEKCWDQIEKLTDHNKDGDVVIHVKHI